MRLPRAALSLLLPPTFNLSRPTYAHSYICFPLLQEHVFIYSSLFSVVCTAEFVPVGWKSNEGKSRCYCAAVDCTPTPSSLLTVSPKQDRCSVCMLPAFPTSIFLPGIPDYCSICLIALSECLLFVQCDVLEVTASIQNVPGRKSQ